jgi:hypothetical protein
MDIGQGRRRRSRSKSQTWQDREGENAAEDEDVEMREVGWEVKGDRKGRSGWKGREDIGKEGKKGKEEAGKGRGKAREESGKGKEKKGKDKKGKEPKGREEDDRSREDSPPLYSGGRPYKKTMCKHFERGSCKNGSNCTWAHGEEELEDRYRRKHGSWY